MEDAHKVLAANRKIIFPLGYVMMSTAMLSTNASVESAQADVESAV